MVVLRKGRKSYTTPKENKHKKKMLKLAVLKDYKVDENDKINHLCPACPADECGTGVFMATLTDIIVTRVI